MKLPAEQIFVPVDLLPQLPPFPAAADFRQQIILLHDWRHCFWILLTRSPQDNRFCILWPECREFVLEDRERFVLLDGDRVYTEKGYEDPDYREEVLVRDFNTGKVLERWPGIRPPGGWTLKSPLRPPKETGKSPRVLHTRHTFMGHMEATWQIASIDVQKLGKIQIDIVDISVIYYKHFISW